METLWGGPLREKSKNLGKIKKTKKTKKNNILSLLPNLFHFQDLWKIVFLFFFGFLEVFLVLHLSATQDFWKMFFFLNIYFVISHPQDIWKILSAMHPSILLSHPLCKMFWWSHLSVNLLQPTYFGSYGAQDRTSYGCGKAKEGHGRGGGIELRGLGLWGRFLGAPWKIYIWWSQHRWHHLL